MFFNNRHSFMIGLVFGLVFASLIFTYAFFRAVEERDVSEEFSAPYGSYDLKELYEDDEEDLYEFEVSPDPSELRWEV